MTMYDKYSNIASQFLDECDTYARVNGGIVFIFKNKEKMSIGDYGTYKSGPTLSYKGMPDIFAKALHEGLTKEQLTDEVYNHYLKCRDENKRKKMSASNVHDDIADTNPKPSEQTIEDDLREALGKSNPFTEKIIELIAPVLKKQDVSIYKSIIDKQDAIIKDRERKLEKIFDFLYDEYLSDFSGDISYSSKFLKPFEGLMPISTILYHYGVPEKDNKIVACQFNFGLQKSGIAYKTKSSNGKTEWEITCHGNSLLDTAKMAGITHGAIVPDHQKPLSEEEGNELYYNYEAFCFVLDIMRRRGVLNYDVFKSLGIWQNREQ